MTFLVEGAIEEGQPEASPEFGHDDRELRLQRDLREIEDSSSDEADPEDMPEAWGEEAYTTQKQWEAFEFSRSPRRVEEYTLWRMARPLSSYNRPRSRNARSVIARESIASSSICGKPYLDTCEQDDPETLPTGGGQAIKEEPVTEPESTRRQAPTPPDENLQNDIVMMEPNHQIPLQGAEVVDLTADVDERTEIKTEPAPQVAASQMVVINDGDIDFDLQRRKAKNDWQLEQKMIEIEGGERALARKKEASARVA